MLGQALGPICSMLNQCDASGRDLPLELVSSAKPLLPEMLALLDDLSVQLASIGPNDASWNSTLSTSYILLIVLKHVLDATDVANDTSTSTSSGTALPSAANEEATCVRSDTKHQKAAAHACIATSRLLGRLSGTLHVAAAIPDAARRAADQMLSLTAGHAALELLASLNATNGLQHTPDSSANLVLFAARILWFEADVGEQHDCAAGILSKFGPCVYNQEGFCGSLTLIDAEIELVLAAGECGAMLQGPLSSVFTHHQTAIHFWTMWLLRSAEHLQALTDERGHSRRRKSRVLRLLATACKQLKRLLSANGAGCASYTKWQSDSFRICGESAVCLGSNSLFEFEYVAESVMCSSSVEIIEIHKAVQADLSAMMQAGVLGTFPEVARWLLLRSKAVGSAPTASESESDRPAAFSEIAALLTKLAKAADALQQYVVSTIGINPRTPLLLPPQLEVSKEVVQGLLDEWSLRKKLFIAVHTSQHE